jgi:hypothetical protein
MKTFTVRFVLLAYFGGMLFWLGVLLVTLTR